MKRLLSLFLVVAAAASLGVQAENYGITVGGVEVTSSNYSNVTGGDITSGTVTYNRQSSTLTLTNVTISCTGSSNYGIHNRSVSGLSIEIVGTCNVSCSSANVFRLDETTHLNIYGHTLNLTMTACENEGRGVIYVGKKLTIHGQYFSVSAHGMLNMKGFRASGSGYPSGFEGDGESVLTFMDGIYAKIDGVGNGINKFASANIFRDCDVRIAVRKEGGSAVSETQAFNLSGDVKCVTPADDGYFDENQGYFVSPIRYNHFTDNYGVIFSKANFPDDNFRDYMLSLGSLEDMMGCREQYLTPDQLQSLTSLDVGYHHISDLTGVGLLTYVTWLRCNNNSLLDLPFTLPPCLEYLNCSNNNLTALPTLPDSLQSLYIDNNQFTSSLTIINNPNLKTLSVAGNTKLTSLNCYNNGLTSLDVRDCTALIDLECYNNQLTSLSRLPSSLFYLNCQNNRLSSLPTLPTNLQSLNISNNQFTSLPALPANIRYVSARSNSFMGLSVKNYSQLATLYLAGNTVLTSLDISSNSALTTLETTDCTALKTLTMQNLSSFNFYGYSIPASVTSFDCSNNNLDTWFPLPNGLTNLVCSNNNFAGLPTLPDGLQEFYCSNNRITTLWLSNRSNLKTLDASNNTLLTELLCHTCALTSLDVSGCTALQNLECSSNPLKTLNVQELTALQTLYCHDDQLTSLNVQGLTALQTLQCYSNQLTSLNVQGLTALQTLQCHANQLTSLNVSTNSNLKTLYCQNNQLTTLNVQNCAALELLACNGNKLNALSLQGCNSLNTIACTRNQIKVDAMTSLVNSLRTIPASSTKGNFMVIAPGEADEGNQINNAQVAIARAKNWVPKKYENGWVEITDIIIRGDIDGDGAVDVSDVNIIVNIILGKAQASSYLGEADLNGDSEIDVSDVNTIVNIILGKE